MDGFVDRYSKCDNQVDAHWYGMDRMDGMGLGIVKGSSVRCGAVR